MLESAISPSPPCSGATALWVGATSKMFSDAAWYQEGLSITRLFNPLNPVMIMTQSELLSSSHPPAPSEVALLANLTALMVDLRFSGEFWQARTWKCVVAPSAGFPYG